MKLKEDEIQALSSVGVTARNWYAVCYTENETPIALFDNEASAIAYRDQFSATSLVIPWPMIIKDYRHLQRL
jgi:hypothetical protein